MARYLGIEVTDGHVKGVVLRTAYRKLLVESVHSVARQGPGLDGITAAVAAVMTEAGPGVDAAYAAMPGTEVSLRVLELPRAVWKRGGRVLATELEGSLPFELDQAVTDAQIIRYDTTVELLAAAARTERVKAFVGALKAGGADPREVGVSSVALGELAAEIPALASPGPVLVLHAYETHADVVILARGVVQMARTLTGQTTPSARDRSVRQTLGSYLASGGEPPVAAYLTGETAYHNLDVVADVLGLAAADVSMGIPLGSIQVSPAVDPSMVQYAPLALALSLRGLGRASRIDLRKGVLAVSGGTQVLRERGWLLAGCVAAIVASWGFTTYMRYVSLVQERDRLRQAMGRVTYEVFGERITDPQRARSLALGGDTDADQDPLPLADAFDVIGVLSAKVPDSVHHDISSLDIQDEHVQMQGVVDTLADRDRIVDALGQYECFQNIQAGRAQRTGADSRQQYALDLELRCPERTGVGGRRPGAGGAAGGGASPVAPSGSGARPSSTGGASGSGT